MRILIGADTFGPDVNGAAKFAERLAAGLIARGHEVHIMAPSPDRGHGTRTEVHEGVELTVHRINSWRWYPHPWLRFALPWRIVHHSARVLEQVQPDVVHFQSHFVVGRGLSIEAKRRGIRVIGTNHTMPENMMQFTMVPKLFHRPFLKAAWNAVRATFARADAITTPTRRAAEFFERATGFTGVTAISCGLDVSAYTAEIGLRDDPVVLFIGRIEAEKNLDELLKAFASLDPEIGARLEVIGHGDQIKHLEALATRLGIRSRVHFAGRVEEEYLKAQLTGASVFAMPSTAELQSIATMEAMASGLPVVAADAMALPHLVHHGENGYLYEPGNIEEFAQRLTDVLLATRRDRERMQRASLRIVADHDIDRTITAFEEMYRGASGAQAASGAESRDVGEDAGASPRVAGVGR